MATGDRRAGDGQAGRLGVDGVFADFPDTAVAARAVLPGEGER